MGGVGWVCGVEGLWVHSKVQETLSYHMLVFGKSLTWVHILEISTLINRSYRGSCTSQPHFSYNATYNATPKLGLKMLRHQRTERNENSSNPNSPVEHKIMFTPSAPFKAPKTQRMSKTFFISCEMVGLIPPH